MISAVRYREGQAPDNDAPYGSTMHDMLDMSMGLSIVIGIVLFVLGRHGNILWMKTWSLGLIACSLLYLSADFIGWF